MMGYFLIDTLNIYRDTFWKLWLRIGYLIYLFDRIVEKLFDLFVATIGHGKIASFVRTYGTHDMEPVTRAAACADIVMESRMKILDEDENWPLWRCYYGAALFKEVWIYYLKMIFQGKRPKPGPSLLTEEKVRQLLGALNESGDNSDSI